jgi:hypothetical protein
MLLGLVKLSRSILDNEEPGEKLDNSRKLKDNFGSVIEYTLAW